VAPVDWAVAWVVVVVVGVVDADVIAVVGVTPGA